MLAEVQSLGFPHTGLIVPWPFFVGGLSFFTCETGKGKTIGRLCRNSGGVFLCESQAWLPKKCEFQVLGKNRGGFWESHLS